MDNLSATSSNRSFMDLEVSAYSTDDLTALVKVWAAQPWAISREKALTLCSPLSLTGVPTTGPSDSIH